MESTNGINDKNNTNSIHADDHTGARISLSVLVTREEYSAASAYMRRHKYANGLSPSMICGALLTVAGFAGMMFGQRISLGMPAAVSLLAAGVLLLCYDVIFAPMFSYASAAREHDERSDLRMACLYEFSGSELRVRSGRADGRLPLAWMTGYSEEPSMFFIRFGAEFLFAIPKRLLDEGQTAELRAILKSGKGGAS